MKVNAAWDATTSASKKYPGCIFAIHKENFEYVCFCLCFVVELIHCFSVSKIGRGETQANERDRQRVRRKKRKEKKKIKIQTIFEKAFQFYFTVRRRLIKVVDE